MTPAKEVQVILPHSEYSKLKENFREAVREEVHTVTTLYEMARISKDHKLMRLQAELDEHLTKSADDRNAAYRWRMIKDTWWCKLFCPKELL